MFVRELLLLNLDALLRAASESSVNQALESCQDSILPGLAYTVASVLCLLVIVGITVNVMKDDNISRSEVYAQTTRSC